MTVLLSATDSVPEKPFTDLLYTTQDLQAIRFMAASVWQLLEAHLQSGGEGELLLYHPTRRAWTNRIVITQPRRLREKDHLTLVGFFGLKTQRANLPLAMKLDQELLPEVSNFDELLGYVTTWLPTGNYANMVLFASLEGKDAWGRSEKHAEAVRLLTPDYYTVVRIYNGELPEGIASPDALRMNKVKYYDYTENPMWRAVRDLNHVETLSA